MDQLCLIITKTKSTVIALVKRIFWFTTHNAFLSTLSICIASLTYFDAKTSGAEQQKALEDARKALNEVVRNLTTQNGIQEKQFAMIAAAEERAKSERERQPKIKIVFQNSPNEFKTKNGSMDYEVKKISTISRSDQQGILVSFSNTGNKALESPRIRITATPQSVSFVNSGVPQNLRNIVDFANWSNLEPISTTIAPVGITVRLDIPEKVEAIDLLAEIAGSNMPNIKSLIHLKVIP